MRRRTSLFIMLVGSAAACSPVYVVKAGLAEMHILGGRRPLAEVVLDPETDERTRGTLTLVMEAREFARDGLGLDVGGSYTSYTRLESDTLALVLSAAPRDRLAPRTWWFPVVGHLPYRGFFDDDDARAAQRELEAEGYDTYLRPTAAFSTLGWFDDPLLSTVVHDDVVEVVTTVLHELSHNHLFVSGQVTFNESFATFVGRAAAAEFFCTRPGGGPDTVWCLRAQARWRDAQRFSRFLDVLVAELEALYGDPALTAEQKVAGREGVFRRAQTRFRERVSPELESLTFASFTDLPLNNATLLSRIRYYHRLPDFQALLVASGGLREAVEVLRAGTHGDADPFTLLPRTTP
ncbi:MAG: aminopeptidase [Longimicrobiales bacterium]|nr:aminopeptidase [Longimicrobiales bacterium]